MKNKFIIYVFVSVLFLSVFATSNVNASEVSKENISNLASFDLNIVETQTKIIDDGHGNTGLIIAVPEVQKDLRVSKKTLSSGTSYWKIYWYGVFINMSFRIKVYYNSSTKTSSIKDYYSPWYRTFGNTVSSEKLYKRGNTVTYRLGYNVPYGSSLAYLTAKVSGNKLITDFKN